MAARKEGYSKLDAYTPYPIEAVWEALGHHKSKLPLLVLLGGLGVLMAIMSTSATVPMSPERCYD